MALVQECNSVEMILASARKLSAAGAATLAGDQEETWATRLKVAAPGGILLHGAKQQQPKH